jgi:hypothetical protein
MSRTIAVQNGSEKADPATARAARPAGPRPSFPAEDTPGRRAAATRRGRRPLSAEAIAYRRRRPPGNGSSRQVAGPARGGCPASRPTPGPAVFYCLPAAHFALSRP